MTTAEMISLVGVILSAAATVAVAFIGVTDRRHRKQEDAAKERAEYRAKIRERESRLSMSMMCTTSEVADLTALAVTGGHTNGNVEQARERAKNARMEYERFLQEIASHSVVKV